jgi:hypothetical protein
MKRFPINLLILLSVVGFRHASSADNSNIIVILADDLGYGCHPGIVERLTRLLKGIQDKDA